MRKYYLFLLLTVFGISSNAQIDCSMLGMSVNVSDTDYIKLYHSGSYLLSPGEHNVIYWNITDLQGGIVHQDTTIGSAAGHMGFYHSVPLNDSMIVSSIIINDSVLDWSSGNKNPMACENIDTLYWEPDTFSNGTILYRWEFVGGINVGSSILSTNENDLEVSLAHIYPNPASTNIIIDHLSKGLGSIAIYNSDGQRFFSTESINQTLTINIENWPNGQYIIWINQRPMQLLSIIH